VVIAAQRGAPRTATLAAAGFFQALGKTVTLVEDVPGLVLMRVVAMLANEAAEAVYTGVCDAEGADTAMLMGLNYPKGPLAWAREIGFDRVVDVLDNLHRLYGDPRYRVSPLLRRLKAEQSRDFAVA
jgi:3-hydroxybutyryl-CoA dehydrogenase